VGAWDLAAFEVSGSWYLAVASFFDGHSRDLNSTVLRWDIDADEFTPHQELPTKGAMDVEAFVQGGVALLAFTGNHDGRHGDATTAESRIFLWDGSRFEDFQTIETSGGYDAELLTVDDGATALLVIVHEKRVDVFEASMAALRRVPAGFADVGFSLLQHVEVPHGRDAKAHSKLKRTC